jgi:hypothetical protein
MLPNFRLLIAALLASIVALSCGFAVFADFGVSREPFTRVPANTMALQLVSDERAQPGMATSMGTSMATSMATSWAAPFGSRTASRAAQRPGDAMNAQAFLVARRDAGRSPHERIAGAVGPRAAASRPESHTLVAALAAARSMPGLAGSRRMPPRGLSAVALLRTDERGIPADALHWPATSQPIAAASNQARGLRPAAAMSIAPMSVAPMPAGLEARKAAPDTLRAAIAFRPDRAVNNAAAADALPAVAAIEPAPSQAVPAAPPAARKAAAPRAGAVRRVMRRPRTWRTRKVVRKAGRWRRTTATRRVIRSASAAGGNGFGWDANYRAPVFRSAPAFQPRAAARHRAPWKTTKTNGDRSASNADQSPWSHDW